MRKTSYVGLDVGSKTCHMVAIDSEGHVLRSTQFPTGEAKLLAALGGVPGEVPIPLEASELAGWLDRVLPPRVARVVISHARTNAWIAKAPRKQDTVDAFT